MKMHVCAWTENHRTHAQSLGSLHMLSLPFDAVPAFALESQSEEQAL